MKSQTILVLSLLSALAISGCSQQSEPAADTAAMPAEKDSMMANDSAMPADSSVRYQVVFSSRWTDADHPLDYPGPKFAGLAVAHFSGLIGASHKPDYVLFAEGAVPSPGIENLSETGKHDPLNEEIDAAIQSGLALAKVESTEPLKDHSKTETAEFTVDNDHPLVSFVAMIAPSPDWFVGAKDINLMENGQWVAEKTVELFPYDSGGDDGATYRADDADTNPKKPTSSLNGNAHFTYGGKLLPVATVTFKKM